MKMLLAKHSIIGHETWRSMEKFFFSLKLQKKIDMFSLQDE
jgi:hypothetical protein